MNKNKAAEILRFTLVNFNGFSYSEFDMSTRMTTLEGSNGAGKTTVMIGSYVPLMPDKNYLKFKNITDKPEQAKESTLYDRLGKSGAVSYSLMTVRVSTGAILHLGVEIVKKNTRDFDLTPFILRNVPANMRMQDVIMERDSSGAHMLRPLTELMGHFVSIGAEPKKYRLPDYFTELFDEGIVPTLMTAPAERAKYHKLMMASFYGGLTGDLQKSIKDYLLPKSSEIESAVQNSQRMLEEVRQTKRSIEDAHITYNRVSLVDAAAFKMIASSYFGAKLEYAKSKQAATMARAALSLAVRQYRSHNAELSTISNKRATVSQDAKQANDELDNAKLRHKLHMDAAELTAKIHKNEPKRDRAQAQFDSACRACSQAEENLDQADRSLKSVQNQINENLKSRNSVAEAYESIQASVGKYNGAKKALINARSLLEDESFDAADIVHRRKSIKNQIMEATTARVPLFHREQNAEAQEQEFLPVFNALTRLRPGTAWSTAFIVSREVLADVRAKSVLVADCKGIEILIRDAKANGEKQSAGRVLVESLRKSNIDITSTDDLSRELTLISEQLSELETAKSNGAARISELRNDLVTEKANFARLTADLTSWESMSVLKTELTKRTAVEFCDVPAVNDFINMSSQEQKALTLKIAEKERILAGISQQITTLSETGIRVADEIGKMAEITGGRLLADYYEDLSEADAILIESKVGPLLSAIIVDDIDAATSLIAQDFNVTHGVWLITESFLANRPLPLSVNELNAIEVGGATFLSPKPANPVLGKIARESEIERLRSDKHQHELLLEEDIELLSELERALSVARRLAHYGQLIETSTPEVARDESIENQRRIDDHIRSEKIKLSGIEAHTTQVVTIRSSLNDINRLSSFIFGDDWKAVLEELTKKASEGIDAQKYLATHQANTAIVTSGLECLRTPPPTSEERAATLENLRVIDERLGKLNEIAQSLDSLNDVSKYLDYFDQVALMEKETGILNALQEKYLTLQSELAIAEEVRSRADDAKTKIAEDRRQKMSEFQNLHDTIQFLRSALIELGIVSDPDALEEASRYVRETQAKLDDLSKLRDDLSIQLGKFEQSVNDSLRHLCGDQDSALAKTKHAMHELVKTSGQWRPLDDAISTADTSLAARLNQPDVEAHYTAFTFATLKETRTDNREGLLRALGYASASNILEIGYTPRTPSEILAEWRQVQRYLQKSLPRDITDNDNVHDALRDMMSSLARLKTKQVEQEMKFRTSSESIANSISNLVRRNITQINRINSGKGLGSIAFGSITGIRINAQRSERMGNFLDALKVEPDMFSDGETLEQALEMLYAKTTGSSAVGINFLDYRRYVDVNIQIKRLGQKEWDSNIEASSGEAIGVGCAILGVILDAMEQQSDALHNRRTKGSIRYLMLDEANRLHSKTLEILADFCETMGVQLLVAAPEVGKARTGITYCLVRRLGEVGQEVDVTYRGRCGYMMDLEEAA